MQELRPEERREFQRLGVSSPIPATLGTIPVSILEIGILGARLQHSAPVDAQYSELRFSYSGNEIAMKCEVVRTAALPSPYPDSGLQSGVRFLAAIGESGDSLRGMLGELVTREINERHAHGPAAIQAPGVDGDRTARGRDAGFIAFRFEHGRWSKRPVFLPEQPSSGFTVARGYDPDELQRLCAVFEAADDEGKRLIRVFAELSVSDALQIPPAV